MLLWRKETGSLLYEWSRPQQGVPLALCLPHCCLGPLGSSPSLGGPDQGSREPRVSAGPTCDELRDLSSLCFHSLVHPLSQSLLRACPPIQGLPVQSEQA